MKWLTPLQQSAWIGLLVCVAGIEHASDQQLQRDSGVSFSTYGILAALSEGTDMTLHMTELAGIAGHSQSRLSHAVAVLEQSDFIRRSRCPGDKRAVHATLTPAGLKVVREAAPAHVTAVRELVFDRLTHEQTEALAEITGVLYEALVTDGCAPPHLPLERRTPASSASVSGETRRSPSSARRSPEA